MPVTAILEVDNYVVRLFISARSRATMLAFFHRALTSHTTTSRTQPRIDPYSASPPPPATRPPSAPPPLHSHRASSSHQASSPSRVISPSRDTSCASSVGYLRGLSRQASRQASMQASRLAVDGGEAATEVAAHLVSVYIPHIQTYPIYTYTRTHTHSEVAAHLVSEATRTRPSAASYLLAYLLTCLLTD